jgi:hypothetical protein
MALASVVPVANAQKLGANFSDPEEYRDIPLAIHKDRGVLPGKVDLSADFPSPGDQGNQSSCVGWAVGYALKSYLEKKERGWPGNSRSQTFSPAYVYNQINGGVDQGSRICDALDLVLTKGIASLESFPYSHDDFTRKPGPSVIDEAKEYAIASFRRLNPDGTGASLTAQARNHLASGFPIVIGMLVGQEFMQLRGDTVYTASGPGNDEGGHAMCTVGYDDNRQAFLVINSWGSSWGHHGFGWVGYDTYNQKVGRAYVVQDIVVYTPSNDRPPSPPIAPTPDDFDPITPESPWIFADSSTRRLQPGELRVRSAEQLWRARNEIYARHGYIFSSERGKAFTRMLGGAYRPVSADGDRIEAGFNDIEQYNIDLVRSFESNRPNPIGPVAKDKWVFPDSSARRLDLSEVSPLSKDRLWRARNEIFARNGYIFQTQRGKDFARDMGHLYEPRTSDMDAVYASFNPIEEYNVNLIKRFE